MSAPVFRFAPSPNGELHLGHAYSALLNQDLARRSGGRLLLRIEDIDIARCTPEFEAALLRDLAWLGVRWEEPVRRQSRHFEEYEFRLRWLIREELVYPSFMSRGDVRAAITAAEDGGKTWPRDPDGVPLYPPDDRLRSRRERSRRMALGGPHAWRLDMAAALKWIEDPLHWEEYAAEDRRHTTSIAARPQDWGDVVIARSDIPTSYHLSVVVDDALQGVTDVVRGEDLRAATGVHRLLQALLGLPAPRYFHHRLILGPDGRKLSKSERATGIAALREAGRTPQDLRRMVGLG